MADATAALAGAPSGSAPPVQNAESVLAGQQGREGDLKTAMDTYIKQEAGASKEESDKLNALEGEAGRLTPPKLDVPPPPVAKSTDPHQVWGSMAMGLAMLGSLFTRTPLTTAMNAAADVMTAYRQGDQAKADQAYTTWKQASQNAIELANFQQKAYDEALSGIERRERMTIEEKTAQDRQIDAQLRGTLTAFGDETGLVRLQESGWQGVQRLQQQREQWAQKFELQLPKLEEQHHYMQALHQMEDDPRFQRLNPVDQYRAMEQLKNSMAPSMQMKPEQKANIESRIQTQVTKTPVYKDWSFANEALGKIENVVNQLKDGSISNAVAADQFTQIFNGGRAIRGFQMQMLTGHASLSDQLDVMAKKLQSGGGVSADQLDQIRQAAELTTRFEAQQMHGVVASAQTEAAREKVDPHNVVPLDYAAFLNENPQNNPYGLSVPNASKLPPNLPDASHLPDGKALKDKSSGQIIAVTKGGKWMPYNAGQ